MISLMSSKSLSRSRLTNAPLPRVGCTFDFVEELMNVYKETHCVSSMNSSVSWVTIHIFMPKDLTTQFWFYLNGSVFSSFINESLLDSHGLDNVITQIVEPSKAHKYSEQSTKLVWSVNNPLTVRLVCTKLPYQSIYGMPLEWNLEATDN